MVTTCARSSVHTPHLLAVLIVSLFAAGPSANAQVNSQQSPTDPASGLLSRIWAGIQEAQRHSSACGSFTETRTSPLLVRPRVLHATFCVQGTVGFRVAYKEPDSLTIIYRDRYINIISGREKRTEAFEAGAGVARAMTYFSSPDSIERLRRDFRVSAEETKSSYFLRLEPVSGRFKERVGPLVTTFDGDFRITRLEINGRNGVRSIFDISIERVDVPLDPKTFELYRPNRR
jgi:hypothetical protein